MKAIKMKTVLLLLPVLLFCFSANAQEAWTLEQCIQYANQNSLTIKQAAFAVKSAQITEKQSRFSRLPSLNSNANVGFQFGRTIDPTTNTFSNNNTSFSSIGVNTGVILFNGFRIKNTIEQSQYDLKAAEKDIESTRNDLSLNIANAYLNILLADEQLLNGNKQLEQAQQQLERTDKLINVGSIPRNDRLNLLSQIAQAEQTVVQAQNSLDLAYLTLKQLLELEPTQDIVVEKPAVTIPQDATPELFNLEEIYNYAVNNQPQIQAGEIRIKSAHKGKDIAKSGLYPTISASAGLSTNWSSQFKDFNNPTLGNVTTTIGPALPVEINGQPALLATTQINQEVTFPKKPFGDQLNENLGENIGLSISIPIFNNYSNKANIARAEIGILNQEIANKRAKNQLKSNIQNAIANAKAAKKSYEATQKSKEAASLALDNAKKRFELGAISTFELANAQITYDQSEINLTTAKYQYLFNIKVVDFYMGRPLNVN